MRSAPPAGRTGRASAAVSGSGRKGSRHGMGILSGLKNLPVFARRPQVFLTPRQYVLVLSHMRSYSTVLSHVLGSHDEISGYAEMHQAYGGPIDFLRMRARVARALDGRLDGRFVLDKVLHDRYRVSTAVLDRDDVRAIFLVRQPPETLASIIAMGRRIDAMKRYADVDTAAEYYVRRVHSLAAMARSMSSTALFVPAEAVVGDSQAALDSIAAYLGLSGGLQPSYQTFKHTGEEVWGDSSERIKSGRIDSRADRRPDVKLPEAALEASWAAYEDWRAAQAGHRGVTRDPRPA